MFIFGQTYTTLTGEVSQALQPGLQELFHHLCLQHVTARLLSGSGHTLNINTNVDLTNAKFVLKEHTSCEVPLPLVTTRL